ncbi:hypothetical protein CHUAL_000814 [Chamberlinius hualienensis]
MAAAVESVDTLTNNDDDRVKRENVRASSMTRSLVDSWPDLVIDKETFRKQKSGRKVDRDPVVIERTNLLSICKLVTKELIESSLKYGRMLDVDHVPLQHFFIVMEHVLRHGLKPKKGLLGPKKELWNVLEIVEKYMVEAQDITASVRDLPTVKTHLGRARAWLRLALMQKRMADYFKCLIDKKDVLLNEFYEPTAFMMCDEAVVIAGLLVGLNVIDCNLCVKEEDLDSQQGVIDFSLYLRDNNSHSYESIQDTDDAHSAAAVTANMSTVLDQKNYLEELNRHLNATVTNLQARVENMVTTNALMKEDLAISKNQILMLQQEIDELKSEQNDLQEEHNRKLEDAKADMTAERETYQTSRAGLDQLYHDAMKKLQEESRLRMEVQRELEIERNSKNEMEVAMKLLEKDIHEKQDTIVSIRQQLDDIKLINLEMYKKLQACESALKHKTDLVTKLEVKMSQMTEVIKQLEENSIRMQVEKESYEEINRKLGVQISESEHKRLALETDLKIEKEWRASMQGSQEVDRERICRMQSEIGQLKIVEKDYHTLRSRHEKLERTCAEHEETLRDLAQHLGESKLKMDDLKEASKLLKEAVWTSDKDALACKQCEKEFSIARRKV